VVGGRRHVPRVMPVSRRPSRAAKTDARSRRLRRLSVSCGWRPPDEACPEEDGGTLAQSLGAVRGGLRTNAQQVAEPATTTVGV